MAEFKLGRLRFVWKDAWANSTAYVKDDIVRYGGKSYVCVSGHTSNSDSTGGFELDLVANRWELMNDGQSWETNWTGTTFYKINDMVRYGGRVYLCNESHTSQVLLEDDQDKWDLFVDGLAFTGSWNGVSFHYKVNDIVTYGGQLYICNTHHTTNGTFDLVKFTLFANGLQFEGSYNNSTTYQPGDVVTYGSNSYIALQTTVGNLPTNPTFWNTINQGVVFRGAWSGATQYYKGDIVKYGAYSYVALRDTLNNNPSTSTSDWGQLVPGQEWKSTYSGATTYTKGDIVQYGGYTYIALQDTTNNLPTNATFWDLLNKGYTFIGVYSAITAYKPGEIVTYGGNVYVAKANTTGNLPSNATFWDLFAKGTDYKSDYAGGTTYKVGDIVKYGGRLYLATAEGSGNLPTNASFWTLYVEGFRWAGAYADATEYRIGDIVRYNARAYVCILGHTSNTAGNIEPPNVTYWNLFTSGFAWQGAWSSATEYELDDVVEYLGSSWISVDSDNLNITPGTNPAKWQLLAQTGDLSPVVTTQGDMIRRGASGNLERLPLGAEGYILVSNSGLPVWEPNNVVNNKVYYVSPDGNNSNDGKSLNRAFASIRHACDTITGPATIFVKTGTYTESLPITVPDSVAIVGDNQRTVIVQPAVGDTTKTMWLLSNASILNKMTFVGLTGMGIGTPGDVDTVTPGGVFVALNPSSPVTTKSPYVLECSSFSTGGIGAIVDGAIHSGLGYGSMLFHGYTMNNEDGIGLWVSNNGKAEVVSCFTYFCYYGYAASTGGQIRSLNGNNSYGRYGAISGGFDSTETPITGTVYGQLFEYTGPTGEFTTGETITSATGSAVVLSSQASTFEIYVKVTSGTFSVGQTITGVTSGVTAEIRSGGIKNQQGFIAIVTGLTAEPLPGSSISFGVGGTYVIQSVSGYVSSPQGYKPAGYALLVLTQDKPTGSPEGTSVSIRIRYSRVRLTGHDFLNIGTGNRTQTNYPGLPTIPPAQGNEIVENFPGRVFYVSTDQDGNFRVGDFFKVDQATGTATLNANAFNLSGLTSLRLGSIGAQLGETINEFSADGTMSGNSNTAVPTEQAVKTYVDTQINNLGIAFNVAFS